MDEELEKLKQQVQELAGKKRRRKKHRFIWAFIALVLLGSAVGSAWLYLHRDTGPLPKAIREKVVFPIYYPKTLPAGYSLKKDSASIEGDNILFFTIANGAKSVRISEQVVPLNPPDLTKISGFKQLAAPAGKAIIGTNESKAVTSVLIANTTLISATGNNVTNDVVASLMQSMASIQSNQ